MTESSVYNMKKMGGELVPVWSGEPEDWEDYQVRSGIYCRGVDKWKVGQRISNLFQRLRRYEIDPDVGTGHH
jgi:hypothetical protein